MGGRGRFHHPRRRKDLKARTECLCWHFISQKGSGGCGYCFSGLFPLAVSLRCLSLCPLMSVVKQLSVLRQYSEHHLQN